MVRLVTTEEMPPRQMRPTIQPEAPDEFVAAAARSAAAEASERLWSEGTSKFDIPPPAPRDPAVMEVVLAAFSALGFALSARALLLLSLVGAFTLAWYAMSKGGVLPLVVLGVYAVFTVIPVTLLEIRKSRS